MAETKRVTGLKARAARIGAKAVAAAAERVVVAARDDVPGDVRVTREGATVVLSGRNLRARSMDDARLRGFGLAAGDGR